MSGLAQPMTDADRHEMKASDGTTITIDDEGNVYFDAPSPAVHTKQDGKNFGQNLAEVIPEEALSQMANDYLDGVNADILSRTDFIQNYNNGIDLLPLKLDAAASVRGNRQSISKIKNPSLLKACMRSQSMSRGQLLPAAGPVKIQTISGDTSTSEDMARRMGNDLNYFFTEVDKGFYTDTDRMLFYRAYGGSAYKKVYRDPLLQRPTSRFVSLDSLIVSEDATDLSDALRKTQELVYNPVQVQKMMARGGWLDTDLGTPMMNISPGRRKIQESQGLSAATVRSQDTSFTIYEGYWSFLSGDYGWEDRKADADMPAPYRITMDRDSRKVLALHRNWKKGDDLFRERQTFVKYGLVPGLGFLDYGFLHLIGNQTRVLTAIWQIMVDHGMLSNFPAGMKVKGIRTATNEINPGLGEFVEVDIGSLKSIKDAIMGMPYGDLGPSLIQLAQMLQEDIESVGGTLDLPTGEGTTNTPVGTILAMIEQQAQDLTAVQQRDHRAQKDELRLIRDLFVENPEDLVHLKRNGAAFDWAQELTMFRDADLVPVSDPNVPSQAHRILLNQFLMSVAEKAPFLFGSKIRDVGKRILLGVGINDADSLLDSPANIAAAQQRMAQQAGGKGARPPDPTKLALAQMELPLKQAEVQIEQQRVQNESQENQREAASQAQDGQLRAEKQSAEINQSQAELAQEERKLSLAEAESSAGNLPVAQEVADLEKTRAQSFQAMGQGAMGFANAKETVAEGERDASDFDNGTINGQEPQAPAPPTQTLSATKPARKTGKAKPKGQK